MGRLKKVRRAVRYTLIYYTVRLFIILSTIFPRRLWLQFCGMLGRIAFTFSAKSRALTVHHLSRAYGKEKNEMEVKQLAKKVFEMLGKNGGEILRASRINSLDQLEKILVTHGYENFERAYQKGKGVIFLTCHVGAFELQITNIAMRGHQPHTIGTPLKDERLNALLWENRTKHGAIAIARGKETFKMIKLLRSGGIVAILIDQDTKVKSVFVNFFGMPAATPIGATTLAMKTGAAIVPTCIHLGEDGLQHMHIFPEISMINSGEEEKDVIENTQVLTDFIESQIRLYPTQWVWMHERWKTKEL